MIVNKNRQIERLKAENEKLKSKNAELLQLIEKMEKNSKEIEQQAIAENERAQRMIVDCESVKKQWQDAIETARLSKSRYDELYKKCRKLKRN